MQTSSQKLPKGVLEIRVEMPVVELEPYLKKAALHIAEHTDVPGFRKGSAPYEVIKIRVGEMALYQEAAAMAIEATLDNAAKEYKFVSVGQPNVQVEKLAPGNPFIYTATFVLLPEVELPDFSKISVNRKPVEVKDAEVAKVVDDLRELRVSEVVTDKPAEKGDLVHVDFDVFKDKVSVEGGAGKKYPVVIGKEQMIPGFEDHLIGLKKDDAKEFKLQFPADYPNKFLAGANCDFKVKVLEVYKRTLPEFNTDFVKQFGDFKTVDDFLKAVRDNLRTDSSKRIENQLEAEVLDKVVASTKIGDIPDQMIASETHKMIDELRQNIESRGLKLDEYLMQMKKKVEDLTLDFSSDAVKRVKFALVVRKVAETEKFITLPEEIEKELKYYQQHYHDNKDAQEEVKTPGFKRYLENVLVNKKAIEFLKSKIVK